MRQHKKDGLKGILGILQMPRDAPADTEHEGTMPADQFREGRLIAPGHEAREELAIRWAGLLQPPQDICGPVILASNSYSPLDQRASRHSEYFRKSAPRGASDPLSNLASTPSPRHNLHMPDLPIQLTYDRGTVVVSDGPEGFVFQSLPGVLFDPRTSTHRAQGRHYRAIVEQLIREKRTYEDAARGWPAEQTGWKLNAERTPRDYQKAALAAWLKSRRGVVVMPTGTGKTFTAFLCIEKVGRPDARGHAEDRPDGAVGTGTRTVLRRRGRHGRRRASSTTSR